MKCTVKSIRGWMAAPVLILAASLTLAVSGARAADDGAQLGPQELVTKVAQDTLKDLDAHRGEYKQNPKRVRELVDKNMLPHFDTAYAAQLVLAKYWRTATADQRKRFVDAFYQSLLQNYGDALLEFTPDRLKILPFQGKPDDKVVTVRTEVRRDNGSRIPVKPGSAMSSGIATAAMPESSRARGSPAPRNTSTRLRLASCLNPSTSTTSTGRRAASRSGKLAG
jgi:ABC-type transporter MlaC component